MLSVAEFLKMARIFYIPRNDWLLRFDNTWHHQGTFYRRTAHLGYDNSYRVFGDFDHNQRLRKAHKSIRSSRYYRRHAPHRRRLAQ